MAKFLINREDLGNRTVGYMTYVSETKEFMGYTIKQLKSMLGKGERIYGLTLDKDGEIVMDAEGFKTTNYMCRSGINSLTPANELDTIANVFYTVVGKVGNEFEVISSRYGRLRFAESKVKLLCELGCVQGGVYLDKGKLSICEGVEQDAKAE